MWKKRASATSSGQARLIAKNKDRKVEKYKLWSQYQRALKSEGEPTMGGGPSHNRGAGSHASAEDSTSADRLSGNSQWQGAAASSEEGAPRRHRKKQKSSAAAVARRKWEQEQTEVTRAREEAEAAKAEVERQKSEARKRRSDQQAQYKKRTKKGQPVLGNQIDVMLEKIKRGM